MAEYASEQSWQNMQKADWYFRKASRLFIKERDKVSVEGVPLPGMLILRKILRDGPCRLKDLYDELDFTSGAVTAICDKLEKLGVAKRIPSTEDRRSVKLGITPEGRELLSRDRAVGIRCITTLFAGVTDAELVSLLHILPKMADNLTHFSDDVMRTVQACSENLEPARDSIPEDDQYLTY